jgi:hypothetical protein
MSKAGRPLKPIKPTGQEQTIKRKLFLKDHHIVQARPVNPVK